MAAWEEDQIIETVEDLARKFEYFNSNLKYLLGWELNREKQKEGFKELEDFLREECVEKIIRLVNLINAGKTEEELFREKVKTAIEQMKYRELEDFVRRSEDAR